jgi:cytidylate kinase
LAKKTIQIAIDGPVASGKSSVGKKIATALGFLFLDTGVMYRAVTWAALANGIPIFEELMVTKLAEEIDIKIQKPSLDDGRINDIFVNSVDITWEIRKSSVNQNVSEVSQYRGVREILTIKQRQIAEAGNIVMAGRDIGTVVLPDADVKIFLDASVEERANRRYKEKKNRQVNVFLKEIIKNVRHRDMIDSTRQIAPLIPAKDAIIINTDEKTVEEVAAEIIELIQKAINQKRK